MYNWGGFYYLDIEAFNIHVNCPHLPYPVPSNYSVTKTMVCYYIIIYRLKDGTIICRLLLRDSCVFLIYRYSCIQ